MDERNHPFIVEFPLRGEWLSPQTPGTKIPSHGTDRLGTRYAYDFLQVDWSRKGWPSYRIHWLHYLLFGVPPHQCYCWGQEVYAPCDGTVIHSCDGHRERKRAHLLTDLFVAFKNAHTFNPEKDSLYSVAGNHLIIQCEDHVYAGLCHLKKGSIQVSEGQRVKKGDLLAQVGHSGNSFSPHLHFQLMDTGDMASAQGLPFAFERYELFSNEMWHEVINGIPTSKDRIRFHKSSRA